MARPEGSGDTSEPNDLPGRNQTSNPSVRRRLIRPGILNMASPAQPPSPDITREEGYHLFNGFMHEELSRQHLTPPEINIELPMSHSIIPFASPLTNPASSATTCQGGDTVLQPLSTSLAGPSHAMTATTVPNNYQQLGQEIRQLANAFDNSPQGRVLREKANQVNLENLTFAQFHSLLAGVFHDGKFDRTTIVAVFIFCSSLVVQALRNQAIKISKNIIKWCFEYIRDRVCSLVQQQGGWDVVLGSVVGQFFKFLATVGVITAATGICLFLWRK